jgi:hypothetical protein
VTPQLQNNLYQELNFWIKGPEREADYLFHALQNLVSARL